MIFSKFKELIYKLLHISGIALNLKTLTKPLNYILFHQSHCLVFILLPAQAKV